MRMDYENKMVYGDKIKKIARYVGDFSIWVPSLGRIIKPGEDVPDFSLDEATNRSDFIIIYS